MPLPRVANATTSSYSARRIVAIWLVMCAAGWSAAILLIRGLFLLIDSVLI